MPDDTPTIPAEEVEVEARSFVHFKEPRSYTRYKCAAYFSPPALTGNLGDIYFTGADSTVWVRGHQGWTMADKTLDDKGVPKQVHPDYLGYIRLDPADSEWKSTWDFRPKPTRKRKQPASSSAQDEQTKPAAPVDTTSIMELFVAMKDCQERTMAELVSVKEDHARTKSEMENIREQHTRTKAELDALKEDYMGTKAELEHAKSKIQQAEKEVQDLKTELNTTNLDLMFIASLEVKQPPAALRLADRKILDLVASIASSHPRLTPTNTNGNPTELEGVRGKLEDVEATVQEMKAQLASTSANLDALIGSKVSKVTIEDDQYYDDLKSRIRAMLDDNHDSDMEL